MVTARKSVRSEDMGHRQGRPSRGAVWAAAGSGGRWRFFLRRERRVEESCFELIRFIPNPQTIVAHLLAYPSSPFHRYRQPIRYHALPNSSPSYSTIQIYISKYPIPFFQHHPQPPRTPNPPPRLSLRPQHSPGLVQDHSRGRQAYPPQQAYDGGARFVEDRYQPERRQIREFDGGGSSGGGGGGR